MNRRESIKLLLSSSTVLAMPKFAFSFEPRKNTMIKPKKLNQGDKIGIIAPGSAVSDPNDLLRAEEIAGLLKVNAVFAKNLKDGKGYKTRTVKERLDDIHEMFSDKSVKAVFSIRGGYGSARLLKELDYKLIGNNPKILLGYSDITALHLAVNRYSGLITYHGPLLLSPFTEWTFDHLKKVIMTKEKIGKLENPGKTDGIRKMFPTRTVYSGKAKGRLTGGNLSIISSLMGTPYEMETKDRIVFIEDVGESPYRIDRMLTQLILSGKLQKAAGVIIGKCHNCEKGSTGGTWDPTFGEVIDDLIKTLNIPCFSGLMIGHTKDQLTLPSGMEAEMDADKGILKINEAGVS